MNKYRNKKVLVDGIMFDSIREAKRYSELLLLRRAGEVSDIQRQVKYELIPAQKDENGKTVERAVTYLADFVYKDKQGKTIVEDVKGMRTDVYKLKRKLMLWVHKIKIVEV